LVITPEDLAAAAVWISPRMVDTQLGWSSPRKVDCQLRVFGRFILSILQAADALGVSPRSADFLWAHARLAAPLSGRRQHPGVGHARAQKSLRSPRFCSRSNSKCLPHFNATATPPAGCPQIALTPALVSKRQ